MRRPRFLADEDLRGSIVRAIRRMAPTLEVTTIVENNLSSMIDEQVLEFAWQHWWLLVSHDVNTMKAVAERRIADGRGIHGLFLVPQRSAIRSVAESLVIIGEASEFEDWRNRIVYLPLSSGFTGERSASFSSRCDELLSSSQERFRAGSGGAKGHRSH